ncbi:MAG: diacylglycerol/polyprenol kinase family protein [Promethearchaeota archaeon]
MIYEINYPLIDLFVKLLITGFFGLNILLILQLIKNNMRNTRKDQEAESNKEGADERNPSLIFLIICLIFIDLVFWFDLKINPGLSPEGFMALMVIFFGLPSLLLIILIFYNILMHLILKKPKLRRYGCEICLREDAHHIKTRFKLDLIRKFFHFLLFGIIILLIKVSERFIGSRPYNEVFGNPDGSTVVLNLGYELPFLMVQSFIIILFYGLSIAFLLLETTRLSKHVHFILNKSIQRTLRKSELDTIAGYVYMPVGYLIVALTCPETITLGIFCLSAFADSAAAIFGIKFGKHKISFNPKKSWEGAIAGFFTAFLSSSLFIGMTWGFFAGLTFLVLDILSPTILKIDDNISVPIFCVLVFFILNLANIPAYTILPLTNI